MTLSLSRKLSAWILGLALLAYSRHAFATAPPLPPRGCNAYSATQISQHTGHSPLNVVLIVLDDASLAELPAFNAPIEWSLNDTTPEFPEDALREATRVRPDLNRLVARSFAKRDGHLGQTHAGPSGPVVVPADIPAGIAPSIFQYAQGQPNDPVHDVLRGFGGLGTLARDAVAIPRHYAPSSVCSPSRAAIMTGRHAHEVGVPGLNDPMHLNEVTIPEFLTKVFDGTQTYRTGIIGKWNLGADEEHRAEPHFDEGFTYRDDYRNDFTGRDIDCFPAYSYLGPDGAPGALCDEQDAATNPLCCSGSSRYDFNRKRVSEGSNPYWRKDPSNENETSICDEDDTTLPGGALNESACLYGTRIYSDAAVNFILRNRENPFFLYLAIQAPHARNVAPRRTLKHYRNYGTCSHDPSIVCRRSDLDCGVGHQCIKRELVDPDRPGGRQAPKAFWAVMEEVDAAVGKVVQIIEGYCSDENHLGQSCETNTDCGNTECKHDLRKNTLVLMTSDNAHSGAPGDFLYGSPQLRGNKLALEEGGIRLGLAAWYGSDSQLGSAASVDLQAIANSVSSHVDLLPTIAHAAGCQPDSYGRYAVGVCHSSAEGPRKICESDGECQGSFCENHILAGHTLLPLLSNTVKNYNEVTATRKYVFAERKAADPAVVSAPVNDAETPATANPCGLHEAATNRALTVTPDRQAGSKQIPTVADPCGSAPKLCISGKCGGVPSGAACNRDEDCQTCVSNGKFCVPDTAVSNCGLKTASATPNYDLCKWAEYRRCHSQNDCNLGAIPSTCMQVRKSCSQNPVASWKLRMNSRSDTPTQLFDLTTNPEELEELNFVDVDPANVVETSLLKHLKGWYACVQSGDDGRDCEYEELP